MKLYIILLFFKEKLLFQYFKFFSGDRGRRYRWKVLIVHPPRDTAWAICWLSRCVIIRTWNLKIDPKV